MGLPKKRCVIAITLLLFVATSMALAGNLKKGIELYDQKKFSEAFQIIQKEAKTGNAEAQYYLGKMYRKGEGVQQDNRQAVYWYTKSVEQGNRKAQNNLAVMYDNGFGVEKDLKKAFELYSQSAAQGTTAAQFNLGMMYRDGQGVKKNYVKAFELFSLAADGGNVRAQNALAILYTQGKGTQRDYTKALYWYRKSADKGYDEAQHAMGVVYQNGEGVPANRDEAIKWYKKAAAQGYARSMANLGSLYYPEDASDTQSWDEAYKWYSLAVEHGDKKNAPLGLGLIHLFGSGRYPVDNAKAYSLFTLAAENGRADGWYWLGVMEEYGFGRPQNEERAMELYRRAADAGVKPAINRLEHGHQDWSLQLFKTLRPLFTPYY